VKAGIVVLVVVIFMPVAAWALGIVGIHYAVVVRDQPLVHPVRVVRVEGSVLKLADGQVIAIDGSDAERLNKQLGQSGYEIDVEGDGSAVSVYARQDGWICGTRWAQPIRVPLIADTVYMNRREIIAVGKIVTVGK
jgi:hypothetical protein